MSCRCECPSKAAVVRFSEVEWYGEPVAYGQPAPLPGTIVPVSAPLARSNLQLKNGVASPPVITPTVDGALRLLINANARAGSPVTVVTEWYRDATANLRLQGQGSVQNSQHQVGTAFDLRADAGGAATAAWWQRLGGQTLDERSREGVVPHWHLELRHANRISIDV